jgi:hypothetical protein
MAFLFILSIVRLFEDQAKVQTLRGGG